MNGKLLISLLADLDRPQSWLAQELGVTAMSVCLWIQNDTKLKDKYLSMIKGIVVNQKHILETTKIWLDNLEVSK